MESNEYISKYIYIIYIYNNKVYIHKYKINTFLKGTEKTDIYTTYILQSRIISSTKKERR